MKIDGVRTNLAPPSQLVIGPFKVNSAGDIEAEVSRGSGAVGVPIELER